MEENLSRSIEDYIEKIYMIAIRDIPVRTTDIANMMNVSKASVNDAIKRLKDLGYVNHEKYKTITLTEKGMEKGAQIYDKHLTLKKFLMEILEVSEEIAEQDACLIEHIISEETFENIKKKLREKA